jgi:hypothetical protein
MKILMLFRSREEEFRCDYIYVAENNKVYSYSFDEDFIVKSEEKTIKDFKHLEELYPEKSKAKKTKISSLAPLLMKKEFPDAKSALYFLGGTIEDFKEGIPAHKKLPEIVNPYDFDFDEEKDSFEKIIESDLEIDETDLLDEFDNTEDDDLENMDFDGDPYR